MLGASGYTGADLVRLAARHPERRDRRADRQHACRQGDGARCFRISSCSTCRRWSNGRRSTGAALDAVFCGLPHGTTQEITAAVLAANPAIKVIDMSADFRLRDMATYAEWYGHEHRAPELQDEAVYGLTEHLSRRRSATARLDRLSGLLSDGGAARARAGRQGRADRRRRHRHRREVRRVRAPAAA